MQELMIKPSMLSSSENDALPKGKILNKKLKKKF